MLKLLIPTTLALAAGLATAQSYTEQAKKWAATKAERQKACGADFGQLKIGMSIERVEQCVAPLRRVSEMGTAMGTITTYRIGGNVMVTTLDDTVQSWTRY